MRIDIYADTICPWCLIGKRRLERALAERPQRAVEITWRAFQLNPSMPPEGMERRHYMELKFGGADRARQVYEPVLAAGAAEGIAFAFDRMVRTPNTQLSHRLVRYATAAGRGEAAMEAVFQAYFTEARDIGDRAVLLEVGERIGLERPGLEAYLHGTEGLLEVLAEDSRAREIGIQGVPTYIFAQKYVLSGAHPPEVLFQLFDLANREGEASGP